MKITEDVVCFYIPGGWCVVYRPVCSVSAVTQCVSDGKQDDLILRWIINDISKDEREKNIKL